MTGIVLDYATVPMGIAALIHLLPIQGVVSDRRLQALYGVPVSDPTTSVAMRHRAVMFGVLGLFVGYAALVPAWRTGAILGCLISDIAFLALALTTAQTHAAMRKVVIADVISIACLVTAYVCGRLPLQASL